MEGEGAITEVRDELFNDFSNVSLLPSRSDAFEETTRRQ